MFGLNWNDPQTLWLNVVNVSLGIVSLACIAAITYAALQDVREKARRRAAEHDAEREVTRMMTGFDGHAFDVPGLGVTMADGGEPQDRPHDSPDAPRPGGK